MGVAFLAGCGGAGLVAPAPPATGQTGASDAARFESFRSSAEQLARKNAPPGYDVVVGSTYVPNDRKMSFSERDVAFKTADKIGFWHGSHAYVFNRSQLKEFPRSSFATVRSGSKQVSIICPQTIINQCGGDPPPDPPPPPDPLTFTAYFSTVSPSAQSLSASRGSACSATLATNGYPYAKMTGDVSSNQWYLVLIPGYPRFAPLAVDYVESLLTVTEVDGSQYSQALQAGYVSAGTTISVGAVVQTDVHVVKYIQITVLDHQPSGPLNTNTIQGLATITCAPEPMVAPLPPWPVDPPGNGWANPPPPVQAPASANRAPF